MLYKCWHRTAIARRNEMALHELSTDRRWTFGQLLAAGESQPVPEGRFVCPQGHSADFVIALLAAWRTEKIVCPLEPGQVPPGFPEPPKNCAHLKLTSGTTAAARLVAFGAEQLAADAGQIAGAMGLRPDWPNLAVISLAHSYGFSNLVLPLLLHGIPMVLAPAPLPELVRRAAEQHKAVTLPAVPALWRAWHEAQAIPANVRLAISAGAPLPLGLEQSIFDSTGIKVHNFYGASECGGIAYDANETPRNDASVAGSPMPSVKLSLNDEGCLTVAGATVGQTYLPEPMESLREGVYQTSDLAELKDGLVYLRGRAGDQINVAGRKVLPETIEAAILRHPQARECVVFGAPGNDEARAEIIVAVVAGTASEKELRAFLHQTLPEWQIPRRWHFVDNLPSGPRGKISRAGCRDRFAT